MGGENRWRSHSFADVDYQIHVHARRIRQSREAISGIAGFGVSSQKRGETSRRFERLNQFFEETFGTVCPCPQNIEKIRFGVVFTK
jgi:hypothetical protein